MSDPLLDADTLNAASSHGGSATPARICLAVAWHPDLDRAGELAVLTERALRAGVELSRGSPAFQRIEGRAAGPLADSYLSRTGPRLELDRGTLRLLPSPGGATVRVEGAPLTVPLDLAPDALTRGLVLELGGRVVLVLRRRAPPGSAEPEMGLFGVSAAIDRLRALVRKAATFKPPVLVTGETGSGKELVARALHDQGPRCDRPWLAVNMGAVPAATVATTLFGHVRGAFTGAVQDQPGLFELADGGTLFLDEVGEMAPEVQAALLRVLETGEVQRLGDRRPRRVDVRVVAATDLDPQEAVASGRLKRPLVERLGGLRIAVPPLRERREDVGVLLAHFLRAEMVQVGLGERLLPGAKPWLPAEAVAELLLRPWPGNVRQLANVARQLVMTSLGQPRADVAVLRHPADPTTELEAAPQPAEREPVADVSDAVLLEELERHGWRVAATARALGLSRPALYRRMAACPGVRKASDVPEAELRAAWAELGGDVAKVAERLRVSERGVRLRVPLR